MLCTWLPPAPTFLDFCLLKGQSCDKRWKEDHSIDFSFRDTLAKTRPRRPHFYLGTGSRRRFPGKRSEAPFIPLFRRKLPQACNICVITVLLHKRAANLPCNYSVPRFDRPYKIKG